MRILTLNFNIKGVGTYRRTFYFSRELARAGHDVTMFTVSGSSRYLMKECFKREWIGEYARPSGPGPWVRLMEGPNLGYRWLPGWGAGPLDIYRRLKEVLDGAYNVIYGFEHHPNVSWPVYLTKRFKKYRFYSDWCDWFGGSSNQFRGWKIAHRVDTFLEERIRFQASRVTVTSDALFDRAIRIGIPRDNILHIPEGAATDYVRPMLQAEARQGLGLPLRVPVVLAVHSGEMLREIEIFNRLLRRLPGALLLIVGRPVAKAAHRAHELGIAERILHTGWVSDEDYPRYLACADVCICPLWDSLNDRARWPAKILDFLSAGRATVTNDVGEVGKLLRAEEVGVLADRDDDQFAEATSHLIADPDYCKHLGESARRVMVEKWDWRNRSEAIAAVVRI